MKKLLLFFSVIGGLLAGNAQTITFNGCHPMFENQDYVFSLETTDASGRNIYITSPVDDNQICGGLGTCEFKILWSSANSRWEFIADSGNGDFTNPFLIYYNSSASTPNPPDLTLGTWVENTAVTNSDCGGNLTGGNAVLTGFVQGTVLGITDFFVNSGVVVYPNPATEMITVASNSQIQGFSVLNLQGQIVLNVVEGNVANISRLQNGVYFLRLNTKDGIQVLNFVKK